MIRRLRYVKSVTLLTHVYYSALVLGRIFTTSLGYDLMISFTLRRVYGGQKISEAESSLFLSLYKFLNLYNITKY